MIFVVDGMLGKLAKWLRILGFDVLFLPAPDSEILAAARREGRALLTRDHELIRRARGLAALLIESEDWEDQVRQVLSRFDLSSEAAPFSRCLECNALLKPVAKADAAPLAPFHVASTSPEFSLCPVCGRMFWPGTHHADMRAKVEVLLAKPVDRG